MQVIPKNMNEYVDSLFDKVSKTLWTKGYHLVICSSSTATCKRLAEQLEAVHPGIVDSFIELTSDEILINGVRTYGRAIPAAKTYFKKHDHWKGPNVSGAALFGGYNLRDDKTAELLNLAESHGWDVTIL